MKTLKIIPIFLLLIFSCAGQEKQNKDTALKPDENITVNKEYDEQGNLIKYDSIYSYSYSSNGKLNDSIKMEFQKHLKNHSLFIDSFSNDFFGKDSLTGQFNPDDFFQKGLINQDEQIKRLMKSMNSLQQLFFEQHSQPIIPAEPENTEPKTEKMSFKQI